MTLDSGCQQAGSPSGLLRCVALMAVLLSVLVCGGWLRLELPILALTGLVAVLCCGNGDVPELGLQLMPLQGWRYWCRVAIQFGLFIALLLAIYVAVVLSLGRGFESLVYRVGSVPESFVRMCVVAPVAEEIIFRALLTVAVLSSLGERGTIAVSGIIFAAIHILGGNASPENQIAGFLLAWAFLKSRTILVPIAFHFGGNLFALAGQIAFGYLYPAL